MEKNSASLEGSRNESLELLSNLSSVPKSFIKMVMKFGIGTSLSIVIGRIRYRVMCRVLYNIDLLKTCQLHYDQLKASRVTRYLILKSMTSYRWRRLIQRIESYFRKDSLRMYINPRSSKEFQRFMSHYNHFIHF